MPLGNLQPLGWVVDVVRITVVGITVVSIGSVVTEFGFSVKKSVIVPDVVVKVVVEDVVVTTETSQLIAGFSLPLLHLLKFFV